MAKQSACSVRCDHKPASIFSVKTYFVNTCAPRNSNSDIWFKLPLLKSEACAGNEVRMELNHFLACCYCRELRCLEYFSLRGCHLWLRSSGGKAPMKLDWKTRTTPSTNTTMHGWSRVTPQKLKKKKKKHGKHEHARVMYPTTCEVFHVYLVHAVKLFRSGRVPLVLRWLHASVPAKPRRAFLHIVIALGYGISHHSVEHCVPPCVFGHALEGGSAGNATLGQPCKEKGRKSTPAMS